MDRVRSEDVATIDARLVGHGAIDRPAIELPDDVTAEGTAASDDGIPVDEVLRLSVDGHTRHVRFEAYAGAVRATGVFDTPEQVRAPDEGESRLPAWADDRGLSLGRTVHLDVVEPGFAYGLRAPGESAVYDAPAAPDDSLASIAKDLEE